MKLEIAFLGAGKMVSAIVNGLINEKIFHPHEMACVSAPDGTSERLSNATGIGRFETLKELLAGGSKRLLLGCKPQQFKDLDPSLAEWTKDCTVLSIMAGITIDTLAKWFPSARYIIRSMPNTPGQIGAGVTAYAMGEKVDEGCRADTERILGSLGRVFPVEEPTIDAVTAMSGSGPGYVFEFACALEEAGKAIGLEQDFARTLAIETILGASAGSLPEPDFQLIGVELKTIPLNAKGKPAESTYVCMVPLNAPAGRWEDSVVYHKLARVLWVPVESDSAIPLTRRRIGRPHLWSPDTDQAVALANDWEELMELVGTGRLDEIDARLGVHLQIRPKARDASMRSWAWIMKTPCAASS